ncbi:MAG: serine/threonine protein kinase [Acidimicrobiia bacterium]|nr:serine/threonine protein kinase [Acidimicrobiia bacterium]
MSDADARIVAETTLAGRYRLVRLIDRGGMAEVWEGKDEILDRPVAIKVLHPRLAGDEQFQGRFRLEAVAAARLAHPNVVATFDTGMDDGVAYIVMELVVGRTLREVLRAEGPLPVAKAVTIAAAVADALHYAHEAGIVHRDVKPGNILIGSDGRVKVADFGIAKAATDQDLTQQGALLGTAKYLAPEQVAGQSQDRRSDVYGLGVVLYEMLCGRAPFTGDTDMAVAYQHAHADPPKLRQLRPDVSRRLEGIVLKAMAKSPEQRFATAADMRTALLSVPFEPDEDDDDLTTSMFARDVPAAPANAVARRRWIVPLVLAVIVVVVLGTVSYLFWQSSTGKRLLGGSTQTKSAAPAAPLVVTPHAFDPPPGDGHEHDADLSKLVDGNPNTVWTTEHYDTGFAGLKPGVGFTLVLNSPRKLSQLKIQSPTSGWAASIYVAPSAKPELAQWGSPVVSHVVNGTTVFDLRGRTGGAVLVWITDLGRNQSVTVGEATLTT